MSQGRISSLAALLLALLPTWSAAAEAVLDEAMQNQLARLVQQAQQQPEAALQALKQLRGQGNSLAAAPNQVRYAEAQIHLAGGDTAAASVIAKELAREPTMSAQALMLSAGVAERLGRTT